MNPVNYNSACHRHGVIMKRRCQYLRWYHKPRGICQWEGCFGDDSHYGITTTPAAKRITDRWAARPAAAATASPPRRPQNCRWKRRGIPIRALLHARAAAPFNPDRVYTLRDRTTEERAQLCGQTTARGRQGSGNDWNFRGFPAACKTHRGTPHSKDSQ